MLEWVRSEFEQQTGSKVSLADLIVLGGCAAAEKAAADAGVPVSVAFQPVPDRRVPEQTDMESFGARAAGGRVPELDHTGEQA